MQVFRLNVGANNQTGEVEVEKAKQVVAKYFDGFTLYKQGVSGFWRGSEEDSIVIEIGADNEDTIKEVAKELAKELEQDAIGLQKVGSMDFIS